MDTIVSTGRSDGFSEEDIVYLKPEVKVEPLLNGWPAWPHLIAPLQHGLNVAFRHLPIMRSFVAAPSVHVAATRNPAMAGGPFLDLPASAAPIVQTMMASTIKDCNKLIQLATDYVEFDRELQSSATGYALDEYYERIPTSMKGLVELFYDINCHPKVRFYEELLNRLGLNDELEQIYIGICPEQTRPFFMSTPRLWDEKGFIRSMRFTDGRIDALAAAHTEGVAFADISNIFSPEVGEAVEPHLYLTKASPVRARHENGKLQVSGDVRVRYVGHACVLIETPDVTVLLDPVIPWEAQESGERYTYYDLPDKIDYVVVSHGHHDHLCAETLLQLRRKIGIVIVPTSNTGSVTDPSIKLLLNRLGIKCVISLDPLESVVLRGGGRMVSLPFPGEHADLDIYAKQGILLELCGRKLMFLVDSNALDLSLYSRLSSEFGPIDSLFLGMECHGAPLSWLYGPLRSSPITRKNDDSRRLSSHKAKRAWEVVSELGPSQVFIYAMGQETYVSHLTGLSYAPDSVQLLEAQKLLELCAQNDVPARQLLGSQLLTC
jgi:L-ascorbate metabolism protein UlaG (beta-lactamase superfamily)